MAKSYLSISSKLVILVFTISIVSVAVTTILAFNLTESILKESAEKTLADESVERGSTISSIVTQRIEGIESLAVNSEILDFLTNTPSGLDDFSYGQKLEKKQDIIGEQVKQFQLNQFTSGLKDLKIVNNAGRPIFSLNDEIALERTPISQVNLAKTEIKFIQDNNKERLLKISVPIISNEFSRQVGTIFATTPTEVFDSVLLNRFGLQETGEVYIVNKDRIMVSESIFVEDAPFIQKVNTEPVVLCFEKGLSISGMTYTDYRGVEIFGVSYCEKDLGFVVITEVDESVILQPIFDLQMKIAIAGGGIMIIASFAAIVLARRISQPILNLKKATNEISKGNFDVQTNIETNDEIGELSSSFDNMAKTIKETISAITKRENIIQRQEHILMKYSEEKKECCVCLVDIVGSITIKESFSEEQARIYYDKFFDHVSKIVEKHKGISVKVVDDSLLFYFPVTKGSEITGEQAVRCCLDIANSNKDLNEKLNSEDLPGIAYRISSTIGQVNVTKSTTGTLQDIFGEPVNLCFKINQYALPSTVIIGNSLYQIIKNSDQFHCTKMDQSLIKGLKYSIFFVSQK